MQKVIKISIFLFTLASTILGQPFCLEYFPTNFGSQTSQPIATDVRRYNHNTSVNGMTNYLHINVNLCPYQIEPWNDGKNQKIRPNVTDELSPLPNQKSYLIESNLSPPIDNRKEHFFSQLAGLQLLQYNFDSKVFLDLLEQLKKRKTKISFHYHDTSHSYSKNRYCKKCIANTIQSASNWIAIPSDKRIKLHFYKFELAWSKTEKIRPIRESYLQTKLTYLHSVDRSLSTGTLHAKSNTLRRIRWTGWLEHKGWNQLPWTESNV